MKTWLSNILMAIIIVCTLFMIISFFWTFPKWVVIGDTVLLIIAIVCVLVLEKKKK